MKLRPANKNELAELSELCMRSKAHWGYDEAFLDACRDALVVSADAAAADLVCVAERDGQLVGVAQIDPGDKGDIGDAELDLLFVEPQAMGTGVGRALLSWVCDRCRALGISTLRILSDPGARAFYEAMGAQFVRMAPSDSIANRQLPLLVLAISSAPNALASSRLADARDGLTRLERVILTELGALERERDGAGVKTAMLYGRVLEHIDVSVTEFQAVLARLVGR